MVKVVAEIILEIEGTDDDEEAFDILYKELNWDWKTNSKMEIPLSKSTTIIDILPEWY